MDGSIDMTDMDDKELEPRQRVRSPLDQAYRAWGEGDYASAIAELNHVLETQPYSREALEMKIDVLRHANLNLYFAGQISKRYLAVKGAYQGLTQSNRRLGRWRRIEGELEDLARDPFQKPDTAYRAAILRFADDVTMTDTHEIDLVEVSEMSEALGTRNARLVKGLVEARLGEQVKSAETLESTVCAVPPTHEGFGILSRTYAALGRWQRAAALAHLSVISSNHVWYTTGAINSETLQSLQRSYSEFNPIQRDAEGLRYSGLPRFLSSLEDLPRTPIRLPLTLKRCVKRLVPRRLLLGIEGLINGTPAGQWIRQRRYR